MTPSRQDHQNAGRRVTPARVTSLLLAGALGLTAIAGCSDDDSAATVEAEEAESSTTTTTEAAGPTVDALDTYEVAEDRFTWVDDSRPTAEHGGQPELPQRTLDVVVYSPDADPAEAGPWPLIVFGHGSSREGDHYAGTLTAWASAGYVVVAPDFPLSSEGTPGGTKYDDVEAQTGDVSFLISEAIAGFGPDGTDEDLAGVVDPERVGVGGQSFGAITALGVGFNACCADERIDVVTEFAGTWLPLSQDVQDPTTTDRPLLMFHGEADNGAVAYDSALASWRDVLDAPGGFITLTGSGHDDGFFDGPVDPKGTVVVEATLAFYDAALKDDPTGWDRVRQVVEDAGPEVATLQER